jgi:hypothetical protein
VIKYEIARSPNNVNPASKPGNSFSPSGDMVGADETGGEAVEIGEGVGVCVDVRFGVDVDVGCEVCVFVCVTEAPSE